MSRERRPGSIQVSSGVLNSELLHCPQLCFYISIFRTILSDILFDFDASTDESKASKSSVSNQESLEGEWDNVSKFSHISRASALSKQDSRASSAKVARLVRIFTDLDAPHEFADLFARHMLGSGNKDIEVDRGHASKISSASSITYLVKLCQKWADRKSTRLNSSHVD